MTPFTDYSKEYSSHVTAWLSWLAEHHPQDYCKYFDGKISL